MLIMKANAVDHEYVYLLQTVTTSLKWSYTTGNNVWSSPAVSADGSTVYVGSGDDKVYALNALTGYVRWSYTTGGSVHSSPAVSADRSTVYVGSLDYKVYALMAATPTQVCSTLIPSRSF
jgi:outer membrane protein assembly factor BamB